MEEVVEQITFSRINAEDLEEFHRQREKILCAVKDRLSRDQRFAAFLSEPEHLRVSKECANIFLENYFATVKYRLPAALLEYLDWLRGFLSYRNYPPDFLPSMIGAMKIATHAFLDQRKSDDLALTLTQLQRRESAIIQGVHR